MLNVLIDEQSIRRRVADLGSQISQDYQDTPITIVGVLTGSLMFVADLVRVLEMPLRIGFLQASSYRGNATIPGELHILPELMPDVQNRHVLLLDDILDTGRTLSALINHVNDCGAASLKTAVLLRKIGRLEMNAEPDYCGFDIADKFVVGYGLDFNDEYRNLPYIGELTQTG